MKRIICNTHGGAQGNPGPAGVGVVARTESGDLLLEGSQFLGNATEVYAGYAAVVLVLTELRNQVGSDTQNTEVEIRMDSEVVQKQLSGTQQIEEPSLVPQFIEIHNLRVSAFPHVTFVSVSREQNADASRLAQEAIDRKQ